MVSISHPDAARYFDRDVDCIKRFFSRRFGFTSDAPGPSFDDARKLTGTKGAKRLDVDVEASGFSRKMAKELESYMREVGVDGDGGAEDSDVDDDGCEGGESERDEKDEEEIVEGYDTDGGRKAEGRDALDVDVTTSPGDLSETTSRSPVDSLEERRHIHVVMEPISIQH